MRILLLFITLFVLSNSLDLNSQLTTFLNANPPCNKLSYHISLLPQKYQEFLVNHTNSEYTAGGRCFLLSTDSQTEQDIYNNYFSEISAIISDDAIKLRNTLEVYAKVEKQFSDANDATTVERNVKDYFVIASKNNSEVSKYFKSLTLLALRRIKKIIFAKTSILDNECTVENDVYVKCKISLNYAREILKIYKMLAPVILENVNELKVAHLKAGASISQLGGCKEGDNSNLIVVTGSDRRLQELDFSNDASGLFSTDSSIDFSQVSNDSSLQEFIENAEANIDELTNKEEAENSINMSDILEEFASSLGELAENKDIKVEAENNSIDLSEALDDFSSSLGELAENVDNSNKQNEEKIRKINNWSSRLIW